MALGALPMGVGVGVGIGMGVGVGGGGGAGFPGIVIVAVRPCPAALVVVTVYWSPGIRSRNVRPSPPRSLSYSTHLSHLSLCRHDRLTLG